MKTRITNQIKMYDQVARVCASYTSVWDSVPAFVEAHTEFTEKLAELKNYNVLQISATNGVVAQKRLILKSTISAALITSKALSALALKTGDAELLARSIYSNTEWFRGNALLRSARFARLLEDAIEHSTELQDYGIDAAFMAELENRITAYNEVVVDPRKAVIDRKRATSAINRLSSEINTLLSNHMDRILAVFTESAPSFAEDYFNARIVVELKGKRRGTSSDDESNASGYEE